MHEWKLICASVRRREQDAKLLRIRKEGERERAKKEREGWDWDCDGRNGGGNACLHEDRMITKIMKKW